MYSPTQHPRGLLAQHDFLRFREISKCCVGNVLDVGCGGRELEKYLPHECTYLGVDIDTSNDISYGDVYNLLFDDNSFDTVVLSEVLEHLVYPLKALIELRRVTKNFLIISIPNPYDTNQILSMLRNNMNCIDPDHINLFGDNEIINLCNLAGFSKTTPIRFYTYIPVINWISPYKSCFGVYSLYKIIK